MTTLFEKDMTTDIAPVQAEESHPLSLSIIDRALDKGHPLDPDQMAKLVDLQERVWRIEAERQFNNAKVLARAEMPNIVKDKVNSFLNSKYASLENIINVVTPVMTKHGFSM